VIQGDEPLEDLLVGQIGRPLVRLGDRRVEVVMDLLRTDNGL
jgi:hypothetical protein